MDELRDVPRMWFSTTQSGENYYENLYKNVMASLATVRDARALPTIELTVSDPIFEGALVAFARAAREDMPDLKMVQEALSTDWPPHAQGSDRLFEAYEMTLKTAAHCVEKGTAIQRSLNDCAHFIIGQFSETRKAAAKDGSFLLTVPASKLLSDPPDTVDTLYRFFTSGVLYFWRQIDEYEGHAISFLPTYSISCKVRSNFFFLCDEYHLNVDRTLPSQLDLSDEQLIKRVFKDTPILDFFETPIPIAWEYRDRFAHTHIIGRTSSGKTTLIERMVSEDIRSPQKPSLVIMTPHRELVRELQNYAGELGDRLIVVDPSDEKYPPAINPFHSQRQVRPNHVIETFGYILASLDLELTEKQKTLWIETVRMLLVMPKVRGRNATIVDICDFLESPRDYVELVDALPDRDRKYFYKAIIPALNAHGRVEKTIFDGTREEIGYRLRNLLFNDAAREVLSATETNVDFFEELNHGSVILVDTAKSSIGEASTVFGGMVLALIMQAMLARDDHDKRLWHPTFVYVDECANYMSDDISEMLTELRKFNCGLILAHHELAQAYSRSAALAASIVSQPAIRFAHPSSKDAAELSREMRTTAEFLENLPQFHFAHYIHGKTPQAIPVRIEPARHPRLSVAYREAFKFKNRDRVSAGRPTQQKPTIRSAPSAPGPESDDSEWV